MIEMTKRLEGTIALLEAYEQPLSSTQCDEALSAVAALQAALRQISLPSSLTRTPEMVVQNVGRKADEARILLAAYKPHGQSKAQRHLHVRRELVHRLRDLLKQLCDLQTTLTANTPLPARERPAYLQLMPQTSENDQSDQECEAGSPVTPAAPDASSGPESTLTRSQIEMKRATQTAKKGTGDERP